MNSTTSLFTEKNQRKLLRISSYCQILSWIVLFIFIFQAFATLLYEINLATEIPITDLHSALSKYISLLEKSPEYFVKTYINFISIIVNGLALFLILKSTRLCLWILIEIGFNKSIKDI
jgi:hypothetical protein